MHTTLCAALHRRQQLERTVPGASSNKVHFENLPSVACAWMRPESVMRMADRGLRAIRPTRVTNDDGNEESSSDVTLVTAPHTHDVGL